MVFGVSALTSQELRRNGQNSRGLLVGPVGQECEADAICGMALPGKPGSQVGASANALFPGVGCPAVCQAGPAKTCAGGELMPLDHKNRKGKG